MEGNAGSGSAMAGLTPQPCLNVVIIALNKTCDGKRWYTSTKELQLASLEFCIACRSYLTLHLTIDQNTPRGLLAAADAQPPDPKRVVRTRVPRLRARRVTWNMPSAWGLSTPIFAMTDVDCLEFGPDFSGSVEAVTWPQRLKRIDFCDSSRFNEPIDRVEWPAPLQELSFGGHFNQSIAHVKFPALLQELRFCGESSFDQPVDRVEWPAPLQELSFGGHFNQPIAHVKFPALLQELRFCGESSFDQPVAGSFLPSSLRVLDFGAQFDQPVADVVWPETLEKLRFGEIFNQPIDRTTFSSSLVQLTFGEMFNQPIGEADLPDSLQKLVFGMNFNQPVDKVRWPSSLQDLTFGLELGSAESGILLYSCFNQRIDSSAWPKSLRRLTLGHEFNQSLQGLGTWMPNLEVFRLLIDGDMEVGSKSLLRGIEWPTGLRQLAVFEHSNMNKVAIPLTIEVLYIYNGF